MDGQKNIVDWSFTRHTNFEEARPTLQRVKQNLKEPIKYAVVDDCCRSRKLYQEIFGENFPVKLDIFHAVKRLVGTIPANYKQRYRLSNRIAQIFRYQSDQGVERTQKTPDKRTMLDNLDYFLNELNKELFETNQNLYEQLKEQAVLIKVHIEQNCLSDINPGHGTEGNERLHRTLNRSCVVGATLIGHELIKMLLAVIFFHHNRSKVVSTTTSKKKTSRQPKIRHFYAIENKRLEQVQNRFEAKTNFNTDKIGILETFVDKIKTTIDLFANMSSKNQRRALSVEDFFSSMIDSHSKSFVARYRTVYLCPYFF